MPNENAIKQNNSTRKKPKEKEKQGFNVFKEKLISIIEKDKTKNDLNSIYKHLKNGFDMKNEKSESIDLFIDEIVDILRNSKCYPFIAVRAAVEVSLGKTDFLMRKIFKSLKDVIAKEVAFPDKEAHLITNIYDQQRGEALKRWINRHKLDGNLPLEWARKATVCMLNEGMSEGDINIAYEIIDFCLKDYKKDNFDYKDRKELIKQIAIVWGDYKFPEQKAKQIHSVVKFYSKLYKQTVTELEKTNEKLDSMETALSEKSALVKNNKIELMQLRDDVLRLKKENANIYEALEEEKNRVRLTNQYWEKECINMVEKAKIALRTFLKHEINELKLCLDREVPNKEMALKRVLNIEEYLIKMMEGKH